MRLVGVLALNFILEEALVTDSAIRLNQMPLSVEAWKFLAPQRLGVEVSAELAFSSFSIEVHSILTSSASGFQEKESQPVPY